MAQTRFFFCLKKKTSFKTTVVDYGDHGPPRCPRCKAYINPHYQWLSGGREAVCNLCGHYYDIPSAYCCSLDETGNRRDKNERPELCCGTVDYIAPKEYSDL